uniref:Uncharacterized protein n=1 Tax=Anguilla anguilla TaxID=7936 RepID=A0A0E9UVG1_ANGAN
MVSEPEFLTVGHVQLCGFIMQNPF